MYLSTLTPAPGHERAAAYQRIHDDAYGDHQWLWRLFPAAAGTPRDFLFRRDEIDRLPRYHLVSAREPVTPGDAWILRTRPYDPTLEAGDRLLFDLRVAPTVRHQRTGRSQRHDVVMDAKKKLLERHGLSKWGDLPDEERPALYQLAQDATLDWLSRRGRERAGFELDEATCSVRSYLQSGSVDRAERDLAFSSIDVSGELTVRDPEAFKCVLARGIGSAKAFGCGLMLVRRPL